MRIGLLSPVVRNFHQAFHSTCNSSKQFDSNVGCGVGSVFVRAPHIPRMVKMGMLVPPVLHACAHNASRAQRWCIKCVPKPSASTTTSTAAAIITARQLVFTVFIRLIRANVNVLCVCHARERPSAAGTTQHAHKHNTTTPTKRNNNKHTHTPDAMNFAVHDIIISKSYNMLLAAMACGARKAPRRRHVLSRICMHSCMCVCVVRAV